MVQAKKDKYTLGQSDSTKVVAGTPLRANVTLTPTTMDITASVEGVVRDSANLPIQGAIVSLTLSDYTPVIYAVTDATGKYLINTITANQTYNIVVMATNKLLGEFKNIAFSAGDAKTQDFKLDADPSLTRAIICGDLRDSANSNTLLSGAVVSIYQIVNGISTLFAVSFTNEAGLFVLRELVPGDYNIKFSMLNYFPKTVPITITASNTIMPLSVTLVSDGAPGLGTISGMITNSTGTGINRADVILYSVTGTAPNVQLNPEAYTKTNASGVYLFSGVKPGNYRVMSNEVQFQEVTVPVPNAIGPSINRIRLSKAATENLRSFNAANGTLVAPAAIDSTTGFVKGLNLPGSTTVSVDAPVTDTYLLEFKYISTQTNAINVSVNGGAKQTINLPATAGATVANAKTATLDISLNAGSGNTIKFFESTADIVLIGTFTIRSIRRFTASSNAGTLANGATIDPTTGYVSNIGGASNGTRTFTFNVTSPGDIGPYLLTFSYLAGDVARPIKITLNGVDISTNTPPKTATFALSDALTFTVPIQSLNLGVNTLVFQGLSAAAAPYIGPFNLFAGSNVTTIQDVNITPLGSAAKNTTSGFYEGIGGSGDGSLNFTYSAPVDGLYDIDLQYVSADATRKAEFAVNDYNDGTITAFDKTTDMTTASVKLKVVTLKLRQGTNSIRIYK